MDYTTGSGAWGVVSADLNGDGKPDLATANTGSDTLSIFINNGDGTFAGKVDYATGRWPQAVVSADLNGDGKPDLAVANSYGNNTLSVFINNGDGTFAAKTDYTTGTGPYQYSIASADFNGDGKPDLVTADNGNNTVSVLLNNGDGTFAAKVDYTTGSGAWGVVSADFNGDGRLDLAGTNYYGTTLSVLMNNGDGTFASKVDYATGAGPRFVTSADYNGDGKPDIAVMNGNNNTLSVFINNGDGTFASKVDYATGTKPRGVVSADFNSDGKPDLAVANWNSNTLSVLLNTPQTMFYAQASTGNVGIGTISPGTKLAVAGLTGTSSYNLVRVDTATGNFYYDSSSARYKDDIHPFEEDFSKILDLTVKEYTDKTSRESEIGLIAEELDAAGLNHLVISKNGVPDAIKYDRIPMYLLGVLQAQDRRIADLEADGSGTPASPETFDALTARMDTLEMASASLMDFYTSLSLDTLLMKDTDGNLDLGDGTLLVKKVDVQEIATDSLTVRDREDSPTLGTAEIKAGETEVTVETEAVTKQSRIFVTPEALTEQAPAVTDRTDGEGFTVEVLNAREKDLPFSWWIVESATEAVPATP